MPRKPRIEYSGAFYHVISRGNQRQRVFIDTLDHQKYLRVLASYKARYQFRLYAYVLMDNHLHLLIEAANVPLSKILQGIHQSNTMYFNRKYRTVGHLFQGRYEAILCDRERYLLALLKYIHHNPVRATIAESPSEYYWSSDHLYRMRSGNADLVDTEMVLRLFSEKRSRALQKYADFIEDGVTVKRQDIYSVVDQRLLGNDQFVDRIVEKHGSPVKKERNKQVYTLGQIADSVAHAGQVAIEDLRGGRRCRDVVRGRIAFTVLAKEYGYRGIEIAVYLRRDPTAVTQYVGKRDEVLEIIAAVDRKLGADRK